MTKSLSTLFILSTSFLTTGFLAGCATPNARDHLIESYSADDCKSYESLFNDESLNRTITGADFKGVGGGGGTSNSTKSADKFTVPWDKSHDAKVSRDRAALRKGHRQKGCAN